MEGIFKYNKSKSFYARIDGSTVDDKKIYNRRMDSNPSCVER